MKPTLKSINELLPRFDYLRRTYRTTEQFGICPSRTFESAFADLDADGNVIGFTVYAVGDAHDRKHYYSDQYDDVVNISKQIEDAIFASRMDECGYDSKKFRAMIIREIQEAISEGGNHDEG